jgi:hypothetical protein
MKTVKTVEEWKEILDTQLPHRAADTILQSLIGYCYRDISRHRDKDTQSLANALLAFTKISHAGQSPNSRGGEDRSDVSPGRG